MLCGTIAHIPQTPLVHEPIKTMPQFPWRNVMPILGAFSPVGFSNSLDVMDFKRKTPSVTHWTLDSTGVPDFILRRIALAYPSGIE